MTAEEKALFAKMFDELQKSQALLQSVEARMIERHGKVRGSLGQLEVRLQTVERVIQRAFEGNGDSLPSQLQDAQTRLSGLEGWQKTVKGNLWKLAFAAIGALMAAIAGLVKGKSWWLI